MTIYYGLLVGMHFRPPAKIVLECLKQATPLSLRPEPENPYDAEAIQVLISPKDIPPSSFELLRNELPSFGRSLEELLSLDELHMGYLARENNKDLARKQEFSPSGRLQSAGEILPLIESKASEEDPLAQILQAHEAELKWGPNAEAFVKISIPDPSNM